MLSGFPGVSCLEYNSAYHCHPQETYNHNIAYAQESAAETHISVCETPTNNNHNFNPSHMKVSLDN